MKNFIVENIDILSNKFNEKLILATGTLEGDELSFTSLPNKVSFILEEKLEHKKVGDIIDYEGQEMNNYLSCIMEPYGSDGISGILWYGTKENMAPIKKELSVQMRVFIEETKKTDIEENDDGGSPEILYWDFDDGTSLVILYADDNYINFNMDIKGDGVVSYPFGAHLDDVVADEVLYPFIAKELKKIKIAGDYEDVESDFDDDPGYSEEIKINNNKIGTKDKLLVLNLAYHLFCTLQQWDKKDPSDEEFSQKSWLAKKLLKYYQIEQLSNFNEANNIKLVFSNENSNKEYNINLLDNNGTWNVNVQYGKIGGNLKTEEKINTNDFGKAKETYISILKEKLAKGYELENIIVLGTKLKI